jgi:hypothetical protein
LFLIFEGYISDNHLFLEFKFNVYKSFWDDILIGLIYCPTNNPFRDETWVAKVFLFGYNYQRQEKDIKKPPGVSKAVFSFYF